MRISDSQSAAGDANVSQRAPDSSQNKNKDDSSAFSKVLSKKQDSKQDAATAKNGKPSDGDVESAAGALLSMPKTFDSTIETSQMEGTRVVAVPPELQQLVREISVAVNTAGTQQVHIELNSNVLKGLHIRIDRQDGVMSVQFQSTSDQIAKLLSRNVDALSQGLADRGVSVAEIRVTGPQESSRTRDFKGSNSNLGGGRSQGGRQGGRR
jgi:flagellar hook-length control protein FliK